MSKGTGDWHAPEQLKIIIMKGCIPGTQLPESTQNPQPEPGRIALQNQFHNNENIYRFTSVAAALALDAHTEQTPAVSVTKAYPKEEWGSQRESAGQVRAQRCAGEEGNTARRSGDAPGHMGLISENHPGMTAEIPACSPAPVPAAAAPAAAASSSPQSRALLAAASASIPEP